VQMHFIQRKQFSKTNVTSHAFEQISYFKIFPECFRGPLKTLWRPAGLQLDHTDILNATSEYGFVFLYRL